MEFCYGSRPSITFRFIYNLLLFSVVLTSTMKADKIAKLVQDAQVFLRPKLETFIYYGKVELIPPKPNELGEVARGIGHLISSFKSGAWKNLTMRQAILNTLVGLEVGCWFFVGECLGKGSLLGYRLPVPKD